MTRAASEAISGVQVVIPYGNPNASLHLRFVNDYLTFCGRQCEGWSNADTTLSEAMNSSYTCKRCMKAALK